MTVYNPLMHADVTYEDEGGISMVRFTRNRPIGGVPVNDASGSMAGIAHLDAEGGLVELEILSLPTFPLDACAAEYGFADQVGAIGVALGRAVPGRV